MSRARAVLVTGSTGRIGRSVCAELRGRGHRVRGFDRLPSAASGEAADDRVTGDLTRPDDLARAMTGMETVVHLAATPDEDDFLTRLLPDNVVGLYHVLEQARRAGVTRAILASTGQVMRGHEAGAFITPATSAAPRNWYAATKLFLEAAGQAYAYAHGLSVIVLRCGWCPRTRRDVALLEASAHGVSSYLSPGDAGRGFAAAVEAPADVRFAVLFLTSRPLRAARYDLEPTRRVIGYEPRDTFPQGLELITEP